MWTGAGILAGAAVIFIIEGRTLRKRHLMKEFWIFSILHLFATGLSLAQSMHVKIPNPLDAVIYIFKPFVDNLMKYLT